MYQSSLEKSLIASRSSRTERAFPFWSLLLQVWARQHKNIIKVENTDSNGLWLKQNGLWSRGSRLGLRVYLLAIFIQKIANINSTDSPKLIIKHITEGWPSPCCCFQLPGAVGRALVPSAEVLRDPITTLRARNKRDMDQCHLQVVSCTSTSAPTAPSPSSHRHWVTRLM